MSDEAKKNGFTVERCKVSPCLYRVKETGLVLNLHVDDGLGAAPPGAARPFLEWLSAKLDLKFVCDLQAGESFEYLRGDYDHWTPRNNYVIFDKVH